MSFNFRRTACPKKPVAQKVFFQTIIFFSCFSIQLIMDIIQSFLKIIKGFLRHPVYTQIYEERILKLY